MSTARPFSRWLPRQGAVCAFWTLVGLAFASQLYLTSTLLGRTVTWGQTISYSLADWYVYALLSVPSLWLARLPAPLRQLPIALFAARKRTSYVSPYPSA